MRRMLVTGGAGFIGANFVRYWARSHPDDLIIVLDALTYAGNPENLEDVTSERVQLVVDDINNTDRVMALLREHALDTIVHFAAESHVDRSITGPDAFLEANILGTASLLEAARQVWQVEGMAPEHHRFHHVSTDEVYGSLGPDDPAFTETTAYAPNSPYSASKASSDFLVRAWHHTYGLKVTTSNCSNNYGPRHFPEKLIPLMILNALHGKALPVYGDGQNIRDWLFVEDHVRGIERVLDAGVVGETYNIGGENEWANIDIVQLVCRLIDERFAERPTLATAYPQCPAAKGEPCNSLVSFVDDRAGHDFRYAIDTTRIRKKLGFEPATSFEKGIEITIEWYLDNREWWQSILSGTYRHVA
ncbi:MAG: dTDP-glucose 4,6-dehydratase [Gammaproteobacteria bacterium]|nr:MAG: dTDP-glucose 4,6-dehydratase [Gammaproteobacteria bacterium]PIE35873.1 MAG: dTDP-glucose 4,6-dehydratase [Gammaproteobacteria bacterium]